jgi:hypothetical protein
VGPSEALASGLLPPDTEIWDLRRDKTLRHLMPTLMAQAAVVYDPHLPVRGH